MIKPCATDQSANFHLEITEDEKHYYVAIDRVYRDRAKSIAQRFWDAAIAKWVYPRTPEILEALSAEFADRPEAFKIQGHKPQGASVLTHGQTHTSKAVKPIQNAPRSGDSPASTEPLQNALSRIHQLLVEEKARTLDFQKWIAGLDARLASLPAQTAHIPSSSSGIDLDELGASIAQVDRIHDLLLEEKIRASALETRLSQIEAHLARIPTQSPKNATELSAPSNGSVAGDEILNEVRSALAHFAERICSEQPAQGAPANDSRYLSAWLGEKIVRGTYNDPAFVDICGHWNLIRDDLRVVCDLEEKLKNRLRECLNLPDTSKKSLHQLCDEYFDSVGDRDRSKLLSAFRHHRNKLSHEPREPEPIRWLRYLHALTAIALVWPQLSEGPQHGSSSEGETGDDDY